MDADVDPAKIASSRYELLAQERRTRCCRRKVRLCAAGIADVRLILHAVRAGRRCSAAKREYPHNGNQQRDPADHHPDCPRRATYTSKHPSSAMIETITITQASIRPPRVAIAPLPATGAAACPEAIGAAPVTAPAVDPVGRTSAAASCVEPVAAAGVTVAGTAVEVPAAVVEVAPGVCVAARVAVDVGWAATVFVAVGTGAPGARYERNARSPSAAFVPPAAYSSPLLPSQATSPLEITSMT
jgi:hypothetical protein